MNIRCVLTMCIGLILVLAIVHSVTADDGHIDAFVEPIHIIVDAPMEVIVGGDFNITVGVQALYDLTVNELSIEVKDTHRATVYEETLFTSLHVSSIKTRKEETVTASLSVEGDYYITVYFAYTIDSEERTFNTLEGKMGFVREVSYDDLNTQYASLSSDYSSLSTQYTSLQRDYNSISNEMDLFRLSSAGLLMSTVVLAMTTIYFSRRK